MAYYNAVNYEAVGLAAGSHKPNAVHARHVPEWHVVDATSLTVSLLDDETSCLVTCHFPEGEIDEEKVNKCERVFIVFLCIAMIVKFFLPTRVARWYICIPKFLFWLALKGPGMENFGIHTYVHWYLMGIWCVLWIFGIFCGHLVYILCFWYIVPR
jgi:hypothetical protein